MLFQATQAHYLAHCAAHNEPPGDIHEKSTLFNTWSPTTWFVKLRDQQKNITAAYIVTLKSDETDFSFSPVYTLAQLRRYEPVFKDLSERWKEEAFEYFKSGKPTGASVIGAGYYVSVLLEKNRRTRIKSHCIIGQPSRYGEGAWGNTGSFIPGALKELGLKFCYEVGRMD